MGAGFQAVDLDDGRHDERADEAAKLRRDLRLAVGFAVPVLLLAMGPMLVPGLRDGMARLLPLRAWHLLELLLATPVQFVAGWRFYRQGWAEIRHASPGMNTLVMLGSSAAYFYSLLAVVTPGIFPEGTAHRYWSASTSRRGPAAAPPARFADSFACNPTRPGWFAMTRPSICRSIESCPAIGSSCVPANGSPSTASSPRGRATSTSR